jgi:hypothetical protein
VVRVWTQKTQTGNLHPRNHFILSGSQQRIVDAELTADGLTGDDGTKGAVEVSHMITFVALLDHEVIARYPERPGVIAHDIWLTAIAALPPQQAASPQRTADSRA